MRAAPRAHRRIAAALLVGAAAAWTPAARAVDAAWSGYATLEAAASDRDWRYLRSIDRGGTLMGSLLAGQLDLRLHPQWSATLQLRAAQQPEDDDAWTVRPSWAFVAWRPDDAWLLRLGRMRIPLYLQSESLGIGVAHDMARLPVEVYSIAPINEFTGAFVTHNRLLPGDAELSLDGFAGRDDLRSRLWTPTGLPGRVAPGAFQVPLKLSTGGVVLTLRTPDLTARAGLHVARVRQAFGPQAVRYPLVTLAPGVAYYRSAEALPGPPIETTDYFTNQVLVLGAEWRASPRLRAAAELQHTRQSRTELGSGNTGGYVAGFYTVGDATPYLSLAASRAHAAQRSWWRRLSTQTVPDSVPGAELINASMRLAGDGLYPVNQQTLALGTAVSFGVRGRFKAEIAHVRIGERSRLADTPIGGAPLQRTSATVLTVSHSVAF